MTGDSAEDKPAEAPLAGRAVRGAITTGLSQAVKVLVGLASIVVVARLISPDQFGVVAMVSPIAGFVLLFQNMGLNQAVVQARNLSPEHTNALFWYNIIASTAVALVLLILSPVVGWFYDDPRPAYVTAATSLTMLVAGSRQQHTALMNRQMRFTALSIVDAATAVATLAFTIGFAYALRNYWALWLGTFLGTAFNVILVWRLSPWRPSLKVNFAGTRDMFMFGANLTGFLVVNFFSRNLDNVLIARAWGAEAVGLYDRSYKLMMFPLQNINQPLGRVMLPVLARARDEPGRYRRMFLLTITALSLVSIPGVMVGAMLSEEVIAVLLGRQWLEAAPIFFWLSIAAIGQPISNATGWLFISTGRTREMMYWGIFSSIFIVAGFVAGLPWGPVGVAISYAIVQISIIPPLYVWCTRGTPLMARDLYLAMLPTLVGGALTWAVVTELRTILSGIPLIAAALAVSYLLSFACQVATPNGRKTIGTIYDLCIDALPGRLRRKKA